MKKIIILLMSLIIMSSPAYAVRLGDVVGTAYNTDIVAYINNYAIPSYAVNGTSVIVAEDLKNFGFDVEWDKDARTLNIRRNAEVFPCEIIFSKQGMPNTKFSDLIYTDISVNADRIKLPSYAIKGYTMVPIESLSMFGEVNWVQEERAIKLWVDGLHIRNEKQYVEPAIPDLTGSWRSLDDDGAWMEIFNQSGNKICIYLESVNGKGTRIRNTVVENAVISGNECSFSFDEGAFYGTGHIQLVGDEIYLSYPVVKQRSHDSWSVVFGGNKMYYKYKQLDQNDIDRLNSWLSF